VSEANRERVQRVRTRERIIKETSHYSRAEAQRAEKKAAFPVIQDRNLLFFWQTLLQTQVLNFESGTWHCGSARCATIRQVLRGWRRFSLRLVVVTLASGIRNLEFSNQSFWQQPAPSPGLVAFVVNNPPFRLTGSLKKCLHCEVDFNV
jgi:hypothetical protein